MKEKPHHTDFNNSAYDTDRNQFYGSQPDRRERAGKPYYRSLTDCPKCKYGTVDRKVRGEKVIYVCADCDQMWTLEQWNQLPK